MNNALKYLPILGFPLIANAEVVQHEVTGSYTNWDLDDRYVLDYTYYLEEMETEGAIKEELPFLRRTGYVRGSILDAGDANGANLGGRFFLNDDLFFGADYGFDPDDISDGELSIHGGNYFAQNSAYKVTATRNFNWNVTGVSVDTRTVTGLGGGTSVAWGGGIGVGDVSDMSDTFVVRGDATYYFSDYTGVGLNLAYNEASEFVGYQFEVSHYLNERVGVILLAGETYENLEEVTLAVRGRF